MNRVNVLWFLLLLFVIFPIALGSAAIAARSGLFHSSGKPLTDNELKAFWTFAGVGITGAVSLTGYMITNSQEKKNQRRLALDTTVSGLKLIINSEGTGYAPKTAVAGALATLINLGQSTIAMRALSAAWRDKAVDSSSAVWLVSEVIQAGDDKLQMEAARLLSEQANVLCGDHPGNFNWPPILYERWDCSIAIVDARVEIICALIKILVSKPWSWWNEGTGTVWAEATLDEVIKKDTSRFVRSVAADALDILLNIEPKPNDIITFVGGKKTVDSMMKRVSDVGQRPKSAYSDAILQQLREWSLNIGPPG